MSRVLLFVLIFACSAARAGTEAHGGDEVGLEFLALMKTAVGDAAADSGLRARFERAGLGAKLSAVKVVTTDQPLIVEAFGIRQESVAVNEAGKALIQVNRGRWKAISSESLKKAIALHEALSLVGLESTGSYPISGNYAARFGFSEDAILSGDALRKSEARFEAALAAFDAAEVLQTPHQFVGAHTGECLFRGDLEPRKNVGLVFGYFTTELSGDQYYGFNTDPRLPASEFVMAGRWRLFQELIFGFLHRSSPRSPGDSPRSIDGFALLDKTGVVRDQGVFATVGDVPGYGPISTRNYRTEFRVRFGRLITRIRGRMDVSMELPEGRGTFQEAVCSWSTQVVKREDVPRLFRGPSRNYRCASPSGRDYVVNRDPSSGSFDVLVTKRGHNPVESSCVPLGRDRHGCLGESRMGLNMVTAFDGPAKKLTVFENVFGEASGTEMSCADIPRDEALQAYRDRFQP